MASRSIYFLVQVSFLSILFRVILEFFVVGQPFVADISTQPPPSPTIKKPHTALMSQGIMQPSILESLKIYLNCTKLSLLTVN